MSDSERPPIDWDEVHRRVERAAAATERALRPSPAQRKEILVERARRLAAVPAVAAAPGARFDAVTFTLGVERFALAARFVRQVLAVESFTSLPGLPPQFYGVTTAQGELLPIVDLRQLLGPRSSQHALTDLTRLLVIGEGAAELALLVDSVDDMLELEVAQLLEPPASVPASRAALLAGVTAEALVVIDGAALLADPRLFITSPATDAKDTP